MNLMSLYFFFSIIIVITSFYPVKIPFSPGGRLLAARACLGSEGNGLKCEAVRFRLYKRFKGEKYAEFRKVF